MGLIETAKRFFCFEKCMILASFDGFFQFLPKSVEEKVSSGTEKMVKIMEKPPLGRNCQPCIARMLEVDIKLPYVNETKDPIILDKDTELVPVMHAGGTSGSAKRICCIGK